MSCHANAEIGNAGVENAARNFWSGKCRSGKCDTKL